MGRRLSVAFAADVAQFGVDPGHFLFRKRKLGDAPRYGSPEQGRRQKQGYERLLGPERRKIVAEPFGQVVYVGLVQLGRP